MLLTYPERQAERDRWILARRGERNPLNLREPYGYFLENERSATGGIVPVATIMLTNAECAFRCVMCDLWRNTLAEPTEVGAIPEQIGFVLNRLPPAKVVKLYNSGSFFDTRAVPAEDYPAIAKQINGFDRVIVECHPSFVGRRCVDFRDSIAGHLEVAMGLETVHPEVLEKLNKRMTLDQFVEAAAFLQRNEIELRTFILVQPPFMAACDALRWAKRSVDFAFDHGATAVTLIPTRGGNGAMEALDFCPPDLKELEMAMHYGLQLQRGRVFVDLWDLKRNRECAACFDKRVERIRVMNQTQQIAGAVRCDSCEVA